MRFLAAVLFAGGMLSAQVVGPRAAGGVVFNTPSGYGNVAYPGTGGPSRQVPFATALGATVAGRQIPLRNGVGNGGRRGGVGVGAYPVFVGGGFGGYYDQPAYNQQQQPNITIVNNPPVQAAPTVVINQNFAAPPEPVDPGASETTHVFQSAPRQDVLSAAEAVPTPRYFLIAYKDHSVYSALAYWVEDKTMHYVTPQQTHNQASLDLIDVDFTKKLNQR